MDFNLDFNPDKVTASSTGVIAQVVLQKIYLPSSCVAFVMILI